MTYSQTDRVLAIQTTLGPDLAMLTELEGEERISQPYVFNIRFVTQAKPADVAKLLGTAVRIKFGFPEGVTGIPQRHLHGHIRKLRRGMADRSGDSMEWHAEVVPILWFLSRTSDCRIFQQKTIPDIIMEVLQLHGVTSVEKKLMGSYEPRDYVVQYRESALDFIQRLMEQEGIFYWHTHSDSEHKLILADSNSSATPCPIGAVDYLGEDGGVSSVSRLDWEMVVRSGKWTMRDFNFETPSLSLEVSQPTTIDVPEMKSRERFDYPGIYTAAGAGTTVAKHRIENEETFHEVLRGESSIAALHAGMLLDITDATASALLLTEVRHHAEDYSHWTMEVWGREARDPRYANDFTAIPKRVPYRPERITPRPFVQGPQTAIVTGPGGEEIYVDNYGRVKVQFHWDRLGEKNENSSCWIRVSQGWAGQNWGMFHHPRIGQEVIVDFLEGDPDRPIVTGRVYNAENMYPYGLPGEKTKSGVKSRSSKNGSAENFNELRFEDLKGSEQIYMHAEKDLDTVVQNNETRKVGTDGIGNRTTEIKNNEKTDIKGNKTTDVAKNFKETIVGTETRTVTGAVSETFNNSETRTILGPITETITNPYTMTISAGAFTMTANAGINLNSPAPVMVNSSAVINQVAPAVTQTSPSWLQTGTHTGTLYQFNMTTATVVMVNGGIVMTSCGMNLTTCSMNITNFIVAINNGALEIKNKSMLSESYAFTLKRGFHIVSA
jgi:type VI secretion system secreted protein VgrG